MRTILSLAGLALFSAEPCAAQLPSHCFPATEFVPAEPIYIPDAPFQIEFRPVSGDWPTTPTFISWRVEDEPSFAGNQVQEFVFPESFPDFVQVIARSQGPEPECGVWSTGSKLLLVRRFDATPSPTATPIPTEPTGPTPSPTCPPVDPPQYLSPPSGSVQTNLAEVFLTFDGIEFDGVTVGGSPFPYQTLEPNRIRLVNLPPNKFVLWNFIHSYDCYGRARSYFGFFDTGGPTPSPSASPTIPTATITATPTLATPSITPSGSATTTPTLTLSPTVTIPIPTSTDTPGEIQPDGWILSQLL